MFAGGEKRYMLSIGGAGAQGKLNAQIIAKIFQYVKNLQLLIIGFRHGKSSP